jgi:hypothetical protein
VIPYSVAFQIWQYADQAIVNAASLQKLSHAVPINQASTSRVSATSHTGPVEQAHIAWEPRRDSAAESIDVRDAGIIGRRHVAALQFLRVGRARESRLLRTKAINPQLGRRHATCLPVDAA